MPSAEKEALTIEPWAVWIALATLVLIAGVAAFTAWDRVRDASVEDVVTPTAVGDTHYVEKPNAGAGPIGLKYQGKALAMVGERKIRESKLIRAGSDDSGTFTLYRPADERKALPKDRFYMKVKTNDFMEVTSE
jgi:hypothetical protein